MITLLKGCIVSLLVVLTLGVKAQNWNGMFPFLNSDEKKSVNQALQDISSAGKLIQEANNYYKQAFDLQQDSTLDEKTLEKKLKKTEDKALETQMKADGIYSTAYASIYKVCRSNYEHISASKTDDAKAHMAAADSLMKVGTQYRQEAKKIEDPYNKATKLQDAEGNENAAIDNLALAIRLANGQKIEPEEEQGEPGLQDLDDSVGKNIITETHVNSGVPSSGVMVNSDQIKKYQDYENDPSIPEPMVINGNGVNESSDYQLNDAKKLYENYINESTAAEPVSTPVQDTTQEISDTSHQKIANAENETKPVDLILSPGKSASTTSNITKEEENEGSKQSSISVKPMKDREIALTKKVTPENAKRPVIPVKTSFNDVRFAVQIAASRIPLTRAQLWAIYPGNYTVEVVKDNKWYRYQITGFRNFSDAAHIATSSGVSDAYVLATFNGQPINLVKARKATLDKEPGLPGNGYSNKYGKTDYYVQLAASRVRLPDREISEHCLTNNYREIIEQGWFKYQIYVGNSYNDALSEKKSLNCRSFIVGYKDGVKIAF